MKIIKTFESWNDNIIDDSLFTSGKAKYNPKISAGIIKYKTGNVEPYYFAEIEKKGGRFICKIYKKKKNGDKIRLRNKIKNDLKLAHNYVREFLNQKLKSKKKKKKSKSREHINFDVEQMLNANPNINKNIQEPEPILQPTYDIPKSKTTIRHY